MTTFHNRFENLPRFSASKTLWLAMLFAGDTILFAKRHELISTRATCYFLG